MEQVMRIRNRVGKLVLAAGVAVAMAVPATAFAGEVATEPGTHVTAAATRAATPSVEILGADGVEESNTFINTSNYYNWTTPKYQLFASSYNTHPSCYLYGLANGTTPAATLLTSGRTDTHGRGPNQALGTSSDEQTIRNAADVIVGDGNGYDSSAIYYDATDFEAMCDTMDDIAAAIDGVSGKSPRYGTAQDIADLYREYIFGTKGYIAQAIGDGIVAPKTVALVWGYEDGTYQLLSNVASGMDGDGTAAQNRYLETVYGITYNYADKVSDTATASVLNSNAVDLILIGGQSSADFTTLYNQLYDDGLLPKTYYVMNNGSQGSAYGVVMNSPENAQNIGRILGCLYGDAVTNANGTFEGVDQGDWIAYYYDNFYHIESGSLDTVMTSALTGVRNWDGSSATTWTASDVQTYDVDTVQDIIDEGYAFYLSNGYDVVSY